MSLAETSILRSLRSSALALAAALLVAACASPGPGTTSGSSTPGGSPAATTAPMTPATAPVTQSSALPTAHRQWLNLAYAARSGTEKLDLYVPATHASAGAPGLVVYVHGGAWTPGLGDRSDTFSLQVVKYILSLGYAVASVDYRLSNEAHFPAQIQDVKTAVRWLRAHAARYGYSPTAVAAFGDSAGGQLVALLATSAGVPALEGANLGYPGVSSAVSAAVVLYPDVNFLSEETWLSQNAACAGKVANPDLPGSAASKYLGAPVQTVPAVARAADPVTYITAGKPLPKFLIAQGTADCIVPYQGSVQLYNALVTVGGTAAAELILEKGQGHYPDFNYQELLAPVAKFLQQAIGVG